jgi:hypothetical protein
MLTLKTTPFFLPHLVHLASETNVASTRSNHKGTTAHKTPLQEHHTNPIAPTALCPTC